MSSSPVTVQTAPPLLVICLDRPHDPDGYLWTIYLLNPATEGVRDLEVRSGGWTSCGEKIIETSEVVKQFPGLAPGAAVLVETDDAASWDFVIWFRVTLWTDHAKWQMEYSISKGLPYLKVDLPQLGKRGIVRPPDQVQRLE